MKKIFKIILNYLSIFGFFTLTFFSFLHSNVFSNQTVFFYRTIKILTISTFLTLILIFILKKIKKSSTETLIAAIIITVSFHLSFLIIFPVTFDRSITTFLLSTIDYQNSKLSEKKLEEIFINDYVIKKNAIQRRINEQSIINTIDKNDNQNLVLTDKGKKLLQFSQIIKKIYLIK